MFQRKPLGGPDVGQGGHARYLVKFDLVMEDEMPYAAPLASEGFDIAEGNTVRVQADLFSEDTPGCIVGVLPIGEIIVWQEPAFLPVVLPDVVVADKQDLALSEHQHISHELVYFALFAVHILRTSFGHESSPPNSYYIPHPEEMGGGAGERRRRRRLGAGVQGRDSFSNSFFSRNERSGRWTVDGGSFFELTFFEDRMVGWLKIEDCAAALGLEVELLSSQDDDPPFFADVVVVRRKRRAAAT